MTTQPTVKARSAWDWLCSVLVAFAALCLAASVPQTFEMVSVAHDEFGTSVLVVVLEVMAFFALLAPLWVPTWAKTFDAIAYTLLTITSIGNFAGGWNYVWSRTDLKPFWLGVRNWQDPIFGLPVATILLVLFLSGLVPAAMKFFTFLAIKRYRENELDRSPDAVADRAIEPILVQILATQKLQERMLSLNSTVHNPLLLTGQAQLGVTRDDVAALVRDVLGTRQEGEQRRPFETPAQPIREASEGTGPWPAEILAEEEEGYTERELNCKGCFGPCGRCEEVDEPVEDKPKVSRAEALVALAEKGIERLTPDELLALPDSPEREAEFKRRIGNSVDRGINWLVEKGILERKDQSQAVTEAQEAPVEAELTVEAPALPELPQATVVAQGAPEPVSASGSAGSYAVATWTCSGCGKEGSNGAKGKATSWSRDRGLEPALYCADCRKSGQYGK